MKHERTGPRQGSEGCYQMPQIISPRHYLEQSEGCLEQQFFWYLLWHTTVSGIMKRFYQKSESLQECSCVFSELIQAITNKDLSQIIDH